MLHIYNSLTRQKEIFKPIHPGKVGMYVCGNTVYDHCHLGHARAMVSFDVIVRYLRFIGFEVTYVRNITDVDDKIIARAEERQVSVDALTAEFIESMNQDTKALGVLSPDQEPRATVCVAQSIALISKLIEKGFAYVNSLGDVCFQVDAFEGYGKLSHKDLEGLVAGARVEVVKEKRSPLDFVLWKMAKPGEPSWSSPWGAGRPGWHIECSAMAMDALGEQFDIHGGGLDLQFPHHENEIAQSESVTGKPFANYWMHVGMLQVNHEKMAKSAGNFLTISEVLKQHHPEVIRYFLLSSHYRSPLNYSDETIQLAIRGLTRLYQSIKEVNFVDGRDLDEQWIAEYQTAMNDDFNTPVALSVLFQLSHEINKTPSPTLASTLKHLANTLGLLKESPESFLKSGLSTDALDEINQLIEERLQARILKQWARADEIRAELLKRGVEVEDGKAGTTWLKKR